MSTLKVNRLQMTDGRGLYPSRAWVNFNGAGTVAIRSEGNVSSITDTNTGRYVVNFASTLGTSSYAAFISFGTTINSGVNDMLGNAGFTPSVTTSSCRFMVNSGASYYDGDYCMLSATE